MRQWMLSGYEVLFWKVLNLCVIFFSATFIWFGFVAIEKENGKVVINLTIKSLETDVIWVYEVLFWKVFKICIGLSEKLNAWSSFKVPST